MGVFFSTFVKVVQSSLRFKAILSDIEINDSVAKLKRLIIRVSFISNVGGGDAWFAALFLF